MHIFSEGIKITTNEQSCLLHIIPDAEVWLTDIINSKIQAKRVTLIDEWLPRLYADSSVAELPANNIALVELILARDDYKTRLQQDAEQDSPEPLRRHNIAKFEGTSRVGMDVRRPDRNPSDATVTLFPSGIDLDDQDCGCILAYVQDLDDWIIGALLGQINRGKKNMIREWQPIILADPSVTTMPATEEGLINMIVARDDYKRSN